MAEDMVSNETIRQVAHQIAEAFQPRKVILFGSYARGEQTANSDVDLLVLTDADIPDDRGAAIRKFLWQHNFPIDIVVRSTASFEEFRDVFGSLSYEVATDGVTLYEQPQK